MKFNEICKNYKKLTVDEEKVLIGKAKAGDVKSKQELVNSVLPGIVKSAVTHKQKYRVNLEVLDLISEGVLGAYHAIDTYNPNSNAKFSTYALIEHGFVNHYIKKAIMNSTILAGSTKQKTGKDAKFEVHSLEESIGDNFTIGDTVVSETNEAFYSDAMTIRDLVSKYESKLTEIEKAVLIYTSDGLSCREVGKIMNRSGYGVTIHIKKAIEKLQTICSEQEVLCVPSTT